MMKGRFVSYRDRGTMSMLFIQLMDIANNKNSQWDESSITGTSGCISWSIYPYEDVSAKKRRIDRELAVPDGFQQTPV